VHRPAGARHPPLHRRQESFTLGNLNLRYGLTGSLEVQLGWNGFAFQRSRDSSGAISRRSGGGDARIALRQSLSHPDGDGFSLALMPYVSLPTGRVPFGSGGWGAGMLVPVSYSLPQGLHADFTGEVDAAPNQGGGGRHLAYSGVAGLDVDLSKPLTATFEVAAKRDEDPSGASTQWLGSASLAWRRGRNLQFDAGAVAGLNGAAPDLELYVGVSRRF
jgi:hypothetical protein